MNNKNDEARDAAQNSPDTAGHSEKSQVALREEAVLSFWQENKIFEKSVEKNRGKKGEGELVFYDGPPFATGTPHYGHLLGSTLKDTLPRYKTMRGYCVPRRWGWDCHGLPIEKLIQDENNLATKAEIEKFGIKNFSQAAKASVFRFDKEWKKVIPRLGRFVDMENHYTTMDSKFMESVWWAFSELYKKGLIYEDFRSMHISPKLETPLSNSEVSDCYKEITDISVYVKFEIEKGQELIGQKIGESDLEKVSIIAWTTTPWTLPGNVALAVGEDIEYALVEVEGGEIKGGAAGGTNSEVPENMQGKFIVAKSRIANTFKDKPVKILRDLRGADLAGLSYKPVFNSYSKNTDLKNHENGWKVYTADFVTTEDGTGIVHIAPAFGEDDLKMGQERNLPFVQHVRMDGTITEEVSELAGRQAKPKPTNEEPNKHQETDIEVIKYLAHNGKLFEKEKIVHSYPHCWRTDAPLLNYALSSWFVKVTDFKNKMVDLNRSVNWVPKNIGEKRFGNWLENAKDWGISRSRYWGTTMPIWKSEDGKEIDVIGSVDELRARTKSTNNFILARHGEGEHNIKKYLSANDEGKAFSELTENGLKQVEKMAIELKGKGITKIYSSPLHRTRKTAEMIAEQIGLESSQIIFDERIQEIQSGVLNGKPVSEYRKMFSNDLEKFDKAPSGGETLRDIKKRVGDFLYEVDSENEKETILIVSHDWPIWMMHTVQKGLSNKEAVSLKNAEKDFVPTGYFAEFNFSPIPHDDDYVLDLHRPYIDEITYEKNGQTFRRIPEVFDTWFDSGSMPYAVPHYPFSDEMSPGGFLKKAKAFPADFIAEGLDQTRGWFYTMMVLNTALFGKVPYKNVVVNGLVLAEDGRKMSKSLKNYPDPSYILDKYGADALRFYLLESPIVRAEPLNFSEKGVDEVMKKNIGRLMNVVTFYEMYQESAQENNEDKSIESVDNSAAKNNAFNNPQSPNVLDQWIVSRLNEVIKDVTDNMERYEIDRALRSIPDFIDDLSTWYLRRSRDRFKGQNLEDKKFALQTTRFVLFEFAKILAPFMPFMAEEIYQKVKGHNFESSDKSVHLENWPNGGEINKEIIEKMNQVREVVSFGLEARDKAGIKVRQPLQTLKIKVSTAYLGQALIDLIEDEVNVKEVVYDDTVDGEVWLNTELSDELVREGAARDLIRHIQSERKNAKLNPEDKIFLQFYVGKNEKEIIESFSDEIKNTANVTEINFQDGDFEADDIKVSELQSGIYKFKVHLVK